MNELTENLKEVEWERANRFGKEVVTELIAECLKVAREGTHDLGIIKFVRCRGE